MNWQIIQLENNDEDLEKMQKFLTINSAEFAVPLTQKVNIRNYAKKILTYGYSFAAIQIGREGGKDILGIICGYANDKENFIAFESSFVTASHVRGTGIAVELFQKQIQYCSDCRMERLEFYTDIRNIAARHFYKKMGAVVRTDTDNKRIIHYEVDLRNIKNKGF